MNVWRIARKELYSLRDIKTLALTLAFPIVLSLLLGALPSESFNSSPEIGELQVLYEAPDERNKAAAYWEDYTRQFSDRGIHFVRADHQDGSQEVSHNRFAGYVEWTDTGPIYYENSRGSVQNTIAQGIVAAFADRYRLSLEMEQVGALAAEEVMQENIESDYVREINLSGSRLPSALDYYAIAMVTLIILYISLSAVKLIEDERTRNTAARLLASPVTRADIYAGKVIGTVMINVVNTAIVVLILQYVFNVNWGDNFALLMLILTSQIVFAISLGIGLGQMMNNKAAGAVVMTTIQVGALFGGSYFPVRLLPESLEIISTFSPPRWTIDAIVTLIYTNEQFAIWQGILLNIGISVLVLFAASFVTSRREGI